MTEDGFKKGQSDNLAFVDAIMIANYFSKNEHFVRAEIRGVKASRSGRQSYGDSAIGYVQVKRDNSICTMKCKICPEHRVRTKGYSVSLVVDEANEVVLSVECHDCAAAKGGCKHSVAFLMWVHRRSEEPARTSVQCYWKKSKLAGVGTSLKFLRASEFSNKNRPLQVPAASSEPFLAEFISKGQEVKAESQILKHFVPLDPVKTLAMDRLIDKFRALGGVDFADFNLFCSTEMSADKCEAADKATSNQSADSLWFSLRYGRITASRAHEASKCSTLKGSLVESILGAKKVKSTEAMLRGQTLEPKVLAVVQKHLNIKFSKSGVILNPKYPFLGASPDAVSSEFVLEIKCPSTDKTIVNYVKDCVLSKKCMAQIQVQMLFAGKEKGIFCIADPKFEENGTVTLYVVDYDKDFIENIVKDCTAFWQKSVFPKLIKAAS